MRFFISSLGCKVNIYEAEAVAYQLKQKGWIYDENNPDVQIINTCTVTSTSDAKSRKLIRQLNRKNPNAVTVVMGCFAQLSSEEVLSIEGVDIVIGTNRRKQIYDLVMEYLDNKQQINKVSDSINYVAFEELCLHELSVHTRGFVKIQDGCQNFCTYCAIPYSRGPIKSRPVNAVIDEIKILVDSGVKEVILAGINTGTYGYDLKTINLAKLIDLIITNVPDLYRLRLSSIELMEISDELIEVIEKHQNKVAMHLHIPLQSGCDETLARMNRKYQMSEYFKKIAMIREHFPKIAITTDCLAGFVGETDDEFTTTKENMIKLAFADCHIFPYSRRPNTKADQMSGHLEASVIKERASILQKVAKTSKYNYQKSFLGEVMEVLFEQNKNDYWYGHTSNYLEIRVVYQKDLTNQVKKVKLDKIVNGTILGEVIDNEV